MTGKWTIETRARALANRWLTVHRDRCTTAAGRAVAAYYTVVKPDYAQVVAVDGARNLVLVRQYKHACARPVTELPAGYLDPGESALACAHRELLEETGYRAGVMRHLGSFESSPSVLTTRAHIFLATGLSDTGRQNLDENEEIEVLHVPIDEVVRRTRAEGFLDDISSLAALFLALPHLGSA